MTFNLRALFALTILVVLACMPGYRAKQSPQRDALRQVLDTLR